MLDVLFGGLNPPFPMHLVGENMELRPIWLLKFRIRDPQNAAKCIERGYMISLYIYIYICMRPFFTTVQINLISHVCYLYYV